jgi:hypothetical protein
MRIGFCGAHRTGKSTLAFEVAKRLGIEYIPFSSSDCFKQLGLDPAIERTVEETITLQALILSKFLDTTESHLNFIIDRSPIDFIAYTKFALPEFSLSPYYDKCCEAVKTLDVIFHVQPGIKFVPVSKSFGEDTVQALNKEIVSAFMNCSNTTPFQSDYILCAPNVLKTQDRVPLISIPSSCLDLTARVDLVESVVSTLF